jgi:hypothetical protein
MEGWRLALSDRYAPSARGAIDALPKGSMFGILRRNALLTVVAAVALLVAVGVCLLADEGPDCNILVVLAAIPTLVPFLEPASRWSSQPASLYRVAPFDPGSPGPASPSLNRLSGPAARGDGSFPTLRVALST